VAAIYQISFSLNSIKANRDHGVPRVILFKARFFSFYHAACNVDAVLWWEFCLSVRLSVCLSVTRVDCGLCK